MLSKQERKKEMKK